MATEETANLTEALELFGLPGMTTEAKKTMIELIIGNETYSAEQWQADRDYNREDTEADPCFAGTLATAYRSCRAPVSWPLHGVP